MYQIHGGAAIAIAMATRLACLEGSFLISVRYESRASVETIRGGFGPQSVSEAFASAVIRTETVKVT